MGEGNYRVDRLALSYVSGVYVGQQCGVGRQMES